MPLLPPNLLIKTITIPSNYGNKLAADFFYHLDAACPPIPDYLMGKKIIILKTADHSHQPIMVILDDVLRFPLKLISNSHTILSHNMTDLEYLNEHYNTPNISQYLDKPLALYKYKKISLNLSYV